MAAEYIKHLTVEEIREAAQKRHQQQQAEAEFFWKHLKEENKEER